MANNVTEVSERGEHGGERWQADIQYLEVAERHRKGGQIKRISWRK